MKPIYKYCNLWVLILFPLFVLAQEGNYKFENFGNQSILLNGNVTGSVSDLGLAYYNPARLGLVEKPSFTISGKAYEWFNYNFQNVLDTDEDLSDSNFDGLPGTVAGAFEVDFLPGHKFAYSLISRYRTDIGLNYASGIIFDDPIGPVVDVDERITDISLNNSVKDEWFGLTWAYPFSEKFSIGASLFGSIYGLRANGETFITVRRTNGNVASYTRNLRYKQDVYGLFFKLGAAWRWDKVDMGLNISFPFISLHDDAEAKFEEFLSGLDDIGEEDVFVFFDLDELENRRRTAFGIALGAGVPIGKTKLHFNVEWFSKLSEYERISIDREILEQRGLTQTPFNEELRSVVNFGMGAEVFLSPSFALIGSFSSDYSAFISDANLFDLLNQSAKNVNILNDFWHFGFGFDWKVKNFGDLVLGATYSRTSSNIDDQPDIPGGDTSPSVGEPVEIATEIGVERWRFVVGVEFNLIRKKLEDIPKALQGNGKKKEEKNKEKSEE